MRSLRNLTASFVLACSVSTAWPVPAVEHLAQPPRDLKPLPVRITGRAVALPDHNFKSQWPGTYAEAAFEGSEVFLRVGDEARIQHLLVDGAEVAKQVRPEAGVYRIGGLTAGRHLLRLEIASENQGGPVTFGGFATRKLVKQKEPGRRSRQMEFIGDSHTVGYGNTSPTRECTEDDVWAKTDTSQTFGPLVAQHYGADYEINAISGRGIVRNYGGFIADPLPVAYPFVLFDKATRDTDPHWNPDTVVIALGTNDFTTPLNPGEKWHTRDELHADYETTYLEFLRALRTRYPRALFVLWATDMAEGEIGTEVKKVADRATAGGDSRIVFVPVNGLAMTGCNWHPSVDDDRTIAKSLIATIDARRSR
jgi:lysophospholipase L1-like esterase